MTRLVSAVLLGLIAIYRAVISPWLPRRCRFAPTCSAYAREAIEVHGPWKGARLAIARVARCHPWHAGGHDPVPPHETPHRADHMIDHGVDHRADHPGHRCA